MLRLTKVITNIDKLSKFLLLMGIIFICYGELSRRIDLYFFWETTPLGGLITLGAFISLLYDFFIYKSSKHKSLIYNLKLVSICLFLPASISVIYLNKNSDAYKTADNYIRNSKELKNKLGEVNISPIPIASELYTYETNNHHLSGEARFELILKGSKKYEDVEIKLSKSFQDSLWVVDKIE